VISKLWFGRFKGTKQKQENPPKKILLLLFSWLPFPLLMLLFLGVFVVSEFNSLGYVVLSFIFMGLFLIKKKKISWVYVVSVCCF
jgi:hypothetical protein